MYAVAAVPDVVTAVGRKRHELSGELGRHRLLQRRVGRGALREGGVPVGVNDVLLGPRRR